MHKFPDNKRFAFTIFDDTDLSTVKNVGPIYHLLADLGMRTTKSVWPLASVSDGWHGGGSLQESEYLEFILSRGTEKISIGGTRVSTDSACCIVPGHR